MKNDCCIVEVLFASFEIKILPLLLRSAPKKDLQGDVLLCCGIAYKNSLANNYFFFFFRSCLCLLFCLGNAGNYPYGLHNILTIVELVLDRQ